MVSYIEGAITAQGLGLSDFMVLEVLLHKGPLTISAIGREGIAGKRFDDVGDRPAGEAWAGAAQKLRLGPADPAWSS